MSRHTSTRGANRYLYLPTQQEVATRPNVSKFQGLKIVSAYCQVALKSRLHYMYHPHASRLTTKKLRLKVCLHKFRNVDRWIVRLLNWEIFGRAL